MSVIRVDWVEWATNGTADGKRLEDLKETARECGRKMARRREKAVMDAILDAPDPTRRIEQQERTLRNHKRRDKQPHGHRSRRR